MAKGKKTGGGSRIGRPNKATSDIKAIAQEYGPIAISVLAGIMRDARAPHASRVAAADKLLDRGFGKAPQAIAVSGGEKPVEIRQLSRDELRASLQLAIPKLSG